MIWILFLATIGFQSVAQDVHFSQFFASPLTLNPAETGNFVGDWRVSNIHRQQWNAIGRPFMSTSIGFDRQQYLSKQRFSYGANYLNDQSGDAHLNSNKFVLTVAFHKSLKAHELSIGIQTGYVIKSPKQYTFPDQYNPLTGGFDANLPTMAEDEILQRTSYFDLSTGINWKATSLGFKPQLGIALFHVNKPKETLLVSVRNRLPIRSVFYFSGTIPLNQRLGIEPNGLFMNHQGASDLVLGMKLRLAAVSEKQHKIQSIYAGVFWRNGIKQNSDAGIFMVGAQVKRFDVGFSYDMNVSTLNEVTKGHGAFEISLIYKSFSSLVDKITVPCERY